MDNNNLRDPGVPYAVNGGTPSPSPAPTPLFADAIRSTPPALSGITPAATAAAMPIQAPVPANPTASPQQPAVAGPPVISAPTSKKPRNWRKIAKRSGTITLVLLLIVGGALAFDRIRNQPEQTGSVNSNVASTNIPLSEFASSGSLSLLGTQSLTVNGQLRANESFVLAPQNQPAVGERGQLYYDNTSNQLAYYNGSQFITLPGTDFVQSFQGLSGTVTLTAGNGITINGTTFSNSGVTSFGGQTGDITLGNGMTITDGSLQATGVQSLTSGSGSLTVTDDGAGNLTIVNSGAGTGTVTSTGGTNGQIPLFTAAQNIEDSIISQSGGTTITVTGNLSVTGALSLSSPLSVASGGTGANSLTANGVIVGNGTSAVSSVAAGGAGLCLMSTAGTPAWSACPGAGGVTSLDGLTGVLTIANTSGSGSTVTIDDASTSQKGIAQFNITNFSAASGVIDTIQDIAVSAAPTFGRLTVTSSQASNGMLLVNNTNVGASGNLLDLQLNGSSRRAVTPAGAMTLVGTLNGQTVSSSANFTGTLAVAGLASLNGGATVTGTLTANSLTPTSALTVGATTQSFTVQGSASSTITATNGANTTTVSFQTPTASVNYRLLTAAAGTYDICTTVGNCAGVGGGVTTAGGTTNTLAKFTGSNAIGDSIITDNGSTVTIGGTLAVNTITPSAAMTIGATSQNLTLQGAVTTLTATSGGITNTLQFATPASSNKTITLPNATGTVAVSATGPLAIDAAGNITCATCVTSGGGGGGVGAVDSLDGLTGALTIANSSGTGTTITIDDASTSQKGIAQFNSTNFSASGGVVNTIQDIAVSAAPTFGRLTVTSSQAANPMLLVNNTNVGASGNLLDLQLNGSSRLSVTPAGAMTLVGALNGQTISSAASFTGTLAVAGLASLNGGATVTGTLTANTITPTSSLTVGATSQSFLVQGSAASTITASNSGNDTTLAFQTPTADVTYRFLTAGVAGTYDICTTVGNCLGVGGGVTTAGGNVNRLAKFTTSSAIGDSIITDNGSTVTIGGTLAVNTLTPTAALTIGATSQNLTLQGATTNLTSTSGGITNTLTFATPTTSGKIITIPDANGTLVVSASGPLAISAAGNITCATCATTATSVASLNGLTGALTLANSSGVGSTITIDNASTSQKGIAQFNITNFSAASGVVNTIQNINSAAAPTFGQLTLTSSQASAAMLVVNNTNVSAAGNLVDLQLNGSSRFAVSPAGALTLSSTVNGQTISSAASFTGTLGVTGLASLNGGATVTGTLTANTITPTSSLTVGATNQSFLVQGNASSTLTATNASSTTTVSFQTPTANVNYQFLTAANGSYDICTSAGNCASGGNVSTAGGNTGRIAKFTGSTAIGDSLLSESGSVVTVTGTLAASTAVQAPLFDTATAAALSIGTTNATVINLNQNTAIAATKTLTVAGGATSLTGATSGDALTISNSTSTGNIAVFRDNATAVLTLADGGGATFRNSANSTTAFQVQNSGGINLLSTDTSGNIVRVGATGTDAISSTVSIGTSTGGNQAVNIGSSNGTSLTTIQSGSGNILLQSNDSPASIIAKSGTNGTAAFKVLNEDDISLLTVDSSNSRVYIGNPTADSTGAVLVLDHKNSFGGAQTGDPTGVAGAMYFNAATASFRCYEADHWRDCLASARSSYHRIFELGAADVRGLGELIGNCSGSGCGTASAPGETGHPSISAMNMGSTSSGYNYVGSVGDDEILLGNNDYWRHESVLRLPASGAALSNGTDRYTVRSGFVEQASTDGVDGCFFKYSDNVNSGRWQGTCLSNSSPSTCDTTITVALSTWYRLTVVVNAAGTQADFRINGVSRCTISTNIPTGAGRQTGRATTFIKSLGTGDSELDVDYQEIEGQFGSLR